MSLLTCKSSVIVNGTRRTTDGVTNFADHGDLIANMWPHQYPVLETAPIHKLHREDLVPDGLEALLDWAQVRRNPDRSEPSRRHVLVHNTRSNLGSELQQIVVRLQGIVVKTNLQTVGNWRR